MEPIYFPVFFPGIIFVFFFIYHGSMFCEWNSGAGSVCLRGGGWWCGCVGFGVVVGVDVNMHTSECE